MFNKRIISIIVLASCLFKSVSCFTIETIQKNKHDRTLDRNLAKPVFSFVQTVNGSIISQWYYTTELSRLLLVGEPKVFESFRSGIPVIESFVPIGGLIAFFGPLFDNRFEHFINNIGCSSLEELQEAIKDAIVLSPYSTKAYAASDLLDHLATRLQAKIAYIKDQIEHDFTWDRKALSSVKKSAALAAALIGIKCVTHRYALRDANNAVTKAGLLNALATLGLFPTSCGVLNSCYKILATDPNACNQYLEKYETLLAFVQNLKNQLEAYGSINFKVKNGCIATLKDNKLLWTTGG